MFKINFKGNEQSVFWKCSFIMLLLSIFLYSCKLDHELPDANSISDLTPPVAGFEYRSSIDDFRTIDFTNTSSSATTYEWDFGGGNTSNDKEPSFTFSGEGTFPVTLTSSDAKGVSATTTVDVIVVEGPFQPVILEAGFEDGDLPNGTGDGRDSWRVDWATIVGISSSPVTFGLQAGKLEVSSARAGYQEIAVEPNSPYDLNFWYTMKNDMPDPWAIVSIVGVTQFGPIESQQDAIDGTIASLTVNDISDPSTYVKEKFSFNSGDNSTVAIYFYNNANVEARFDDFSIDIGIPGPVAPSVGFDVAQSAVDYLDYTFTNTSTGGETYMWDFGDGNTSTDESPNHVYDSPDVYTVTLEVTSSAGLSATLEKTIDIQAPVTADFTFVTNQVPATYQTVQFMDASVGAVELLWEFGDEYQFVGMNPEHTYMADGIYPVTLTATSLTGLQDAITMDVTIALGFIAAINDPGVEGGTGAWRNNALEADADIVFGDGTWVTQSSSTSHMGSKSAKLPTIESNGGDQFSTRRWIYQAIEVEENTNYDIDFWVRNKDSNVGTTVTVQIYDAPFDEVAVIDDASRIIATEILNAASGHDIKDWTPAKINFNSGSSTMIVLYIYNDWTLDGPTSDDESESYFDTFSITKL